MTDEHRKWIKKAQKGDRQALVSLITAYKNEYFRLALAYVGNQEDAMDAIEDLIVILYEKIGTLKKTEAFSSWSKTILVNGCRKLLREKKKVLALEQPIEEIYHEAFHVEENRLDLEPHLAKLNPQQVETIKLRFYLDYDLNTISEITGVPIGTVKSRLSIGLKKLQESLRGEEHEGSL